MEANIVRSINKTPVKTIDPFNVKSKNKKAFKKRTIQN